MRDLLAHADLARYAGQFVWLELSYDELRNRDFMSKYGASATPTFFVIDRPVQPIGWRLRRPCSSWRRKRSPFRSQSGTIAIQFIALSCSSRLPVKTIQPRL